MQERIVHIWKFIEFNNAWESCDTSRLDEISPSWFSRKKILEKTSSEYKEFIEQLKREHAIETGIVERMYDISSGATETLIEKGFIDTLLSHGDFDDNVTKYQLINHLNDHLSAIDFVFDYIKSDRPLTVGFIKELHQIVTSHQDFAEGRDYLGNKSNIPLLKGAFKERENNPSRLNENGKITFRYCPPEHVAAEMDNLILIYNDLVKKNIHPLIVSAWFHHAFSIIHPFQDGNGRLARLLASLIFIKFDFFPLTVQREMKDVYINSLEDADNGYPQPLVNYFIDIQRKSIEKALNLKTVSSTSFDQVANILAEKLEEHKKIKQAEYDARIVISSKRDKIFAICNENLAKIKDELVQKLNGNAKIAITGDSFGESITEANTYLLSTYSEKHNYTFNNSLPQALFELLIVIRDGEIKKEYSINFLLHHYGNGDDTLAIGTVMKNTIYSYQQINTIFPLSIKPFIISLLLSPEDIDKSANRIVSFLEDCVSVALAQIASEI